MVLFVLAVVWAIYLASWLRNRRVHRNVNSISSFSKQLSILERTSPGGRSIGQQVPSARFNGSSLVVRSASMTRSDARRRRRDVLLALVGVVVVTAGLALVVGGPFIYLQLLADVALVGFVVMLVRAQQMAQQRRSKVRHLHPHTPQQLVPPRAAVGEVTYLVGRSAAQ